ncbi:hypothetical protein ACH3XW_0865 [Acanthocheilonema viteae]
MWYYRLNRYRIQTDHQFITNFNSTISPLLFLDIVSSRYSVQVINIKKMNPKRNRTFVKLKKFRSELEASWNKQKGNMQI